MEGNNNNGGNYNRQNQNANVPVAKKSGITMRDVTIAGVSAVTGGLIGWGVTAIVRSVKNKKAKKKAEAEKKDETKK